MTDTSSDTQTPDRRGTGQRRAAVADQARVVRRYLSAIESGRPGRGAKRLSDGIGNRITKIDELLVSADPLSRVHLTQERIELHAEQVRIGNGNATDVDALERDFVRVARSYGDRHGITYAAWRQVGVDAKVLERAGVHRAERKPPPGARAAAEKSPSPAPAAEKSPSPAPAAEKSPSPAPAAERSPSTPEPTSSNGKISPVPPPSSISELALLLSEERPAAKEPASGGPGRSAPEE